MRSIKRSAKVFLYDEPVGYLYQDEMGFHFSYFKDYIGMPLSLSLPVVQQDFHSEQLFPYFASLIPEGWLKAKYNVLQKIDEQDQFGLLLNNGENMLGAITIKREE
ncbi:HipA N-terminal domain-containing protein [Actinobacillus equuli]|uniref:HipA N-terminal domain-containing protein n=1 Tax=Actinobacillus equuli TaxID=718 RepID=UPI002442AAAC|nr:HipA N-terminal domain-containing protein [Actinobacillus equuli]WGE41963.1 HipA N-terminal domain-containing protein [Actinobacillus equuli subsp. haemolyticus]WGE46324.1 HipA N-terminal domain-containing protein [Actinobacillus equuli subsp. haemolyticus]WGE52680.1 HipA N-terminal domain-containing protein [Actinobacillus equuli subsp. haemolyticus]WGE73122.1 HipA N-terminal domain-containing protein [Actinobacillus equuli subsp. haemolyticus]WGE75167.1 HipA N-terminal domain-containing p